ncbi:MAG: thiamine ABC transporter substrate-binding protein [Thermococci archaeon]|nr:thiamine ABC transporter substrate-binding protein [Thermococci archaeon]
MRYAVVLLPVLLILMAATPAAASSQQTLVVYTYPSFVSWGLANATIPTFEKEYGVKVKVVTMTSGELVNRLILEKSHPYADVVIGIDNGYAAEAVKAGVLESYRPPDIGVVPKWLIDELDPTYHLIPFDYGAIAIDYNNTKIKNPPKTFEALLNPKWKKSLILEDPRTSTTGRAFLLWTIGAFGDPGWLYYWEKLKPQIYAIVKSWDAGWAMWTKGEAPFLVSYVTDPAYDAYYGKRNTSTIGVILLNDTAYVQIEGVGIVKGCRHPKLAREFVNFVLSNAFQSKIATHNWMFPASDNVTLPSVYRLVPRWSRVVNPGNISANYKRWLNEWVELMVQGMSPSQIIKRYSKYYNTSSTTSAASASSALASTSTSASSKKSGSICGPASIAALALLPAVVRKVRKR